ncbi:MAG: M23 family metallopeptidase [Cyclobacteriaceae bacterium]|nr:M23 family metallopeptidase [Cyclobacteriaceae bacterium]
MRSSSFFIVFLILIIALPAFAQSGENPYIFPIRPGQQNYLAGTMGEIRGAHFHGGIDIKTGGATGWEVYAAADGFVARIKTEGGGYGNALYVEHPHLGTTTVYGHLEKYSDVIAAYILKEQYSRKSFSVDIYPDKSLFKVKKGELIAYAGNSGSSSGPHLHFEIRDSRQRPVNPLLLGFMEIKDTQSPVVQKIALKTMNMDSRINSQFGWFEFTPSGLKNEYTLSNTVDVYGEIGFMFMGFDRLNDVPNKNGIPFMTASLDERQIIDIQIDKVPFEDNRQVLCFKDYQALSRESKTYQKLYIDDGNRLAIYRNQKEKGIISIRDSLVHNYEVTLADAYGNKTFIKMKLRGRQPTITTTAATKSFKPFRFQVLDNTMVLMDKKSSDSNISKVYANRRTADLKPSYYVGEYGVYLWDMRRGIPDSVGMTNGTIYPELEMIVPAGSDFKYYKDAFTLHFYTRTLFDTLYLKTDYMDELHRQDVNFLK